MFLITAIAEVARDALVPTAITRVAHLTHSYTHTHTPISPPTNTSDAFSGHLARCRFASSPRGESLRLPQCAAAVDRGWLCGSEVDFFRRARRN